MASLNPAYSSALNRFRRESVTHDLMKAMGEGNATAKLEKFFSLNKGRVAKSFNAKELKEIETTAYQVANAVTRQPEGITGRAFDSFMSMMPGMLESKTGRYLLRNTLGPMGGAGKLSGAGMASAMQFWRAYEAQGGDED